MLINRYIKVDNDVSLVLEQVRNNGKVTFSIDLLVDLSKYEAGKHLINSLIIDDVDIDSLFIENNLSYVDSIIV